MATEHNTLTADNLHASFPHGNIADIPASPTNAYNNFYYADDENKLYYYNGSAWKEFAFELSSNTFDQKADVDLGNISSDGAIFIANLSKAGATVVNFSLGASGEDYLMPAAGMLYLDKGATALGQHATFNVNAKFAHKISSTKNERIYLYVPVAKCDVVKCTYDATGTTGIFQLILDKGEEL